MENPWDIKTFYVSLKELGGIITESLDAGDRNMYDIKYNVNVCRDDLVDELCCDECYDLNDVVDKNKIELGVGDLITVTQVIKSEYHLDIVKESRISTEYLICNDDMSYKINSNPIIAGILSKCGVHLKSFDGIESKIDLMSINDYEKGKVKDWVRTII